MLLAGPLARGRKGEGAFFSAPVLLTMVADGALRALQTCVERQSFGRQGLQQVQVDVAYLDAQLRRYGAAWCEGHSQPIAIGCFRIWRLHWRGGGSACSTQQPQGQGQGCCWMKLWSTAL